MNRIIGWDPPEINIADVVAGDMPGDKIQIDDNHLKRAGVIFPYVLGEYRESGKDRYVISVYGGSGVGKSEIGSLLAHYFKGEGIGSYVMSGDNYPWRFPAENDRNRLNIYRQSGLQALSHEEFFSEEIMAELQALWPSLGDFNEELSQGKPWLQVYQAAGRKALNSFLSTEAEVSFSQINYIIEKFKNATGCIALKRMGRVIDDLKYERVDFSRVEVLIIEWTHGNNPLVEGVDFPVFLYSSPEETLAHRLSRARDKGADNAFFKTVLKLEQAKLNSQADHAGLIVSKSAQILSAPDVQKEISVE